MDDEEDQEHGPAEGRGYHGRSDAVLAPWAYRLRWDVREVG